MTGPSAGGPFRLSPYGLNPFALEPFGLYVHIPFCLRKCSYCDFVSYPVHSFDTSRYCEAVVSELEMLFAGRPCLCNVPFDFGIFWPPVSTVFIGGGTPTVLPLDELSCIIECINKVTGVSRRSSSGSEVEFSVEANPGTVSHEYLSRLRSLGVNRISMGLQSTNDRHLAMLGRPHTFSEFLDAYESAVSAGFSNISVDLMYGLPYQTLDEWREDIARVVALAPAHISCYALTVAEGTDLCSRLAAGSLPQPSDDLAADMYLYAASALPEAGYVHYEISNYAKPGMECRHNQIYWANGYYAAVGVAAHSHLPMVRYANTEDVEHYVSMIDMGLRTVEQVERLSQERELSDTFILGLRTSAGIDIPSLSDRFGVEPVSELVERLERLSATGLVSVSDGRVRLTDRGMLLSNEIMVELL
jgi:oxygen-independent coproporphyrinogen-3 oxidase